MISVERVLTGGTFANYASRGGGGSYRKFYLKKYTSLIVPRKNKEKKSEKMFELHVHRPLPLFLDDAW